MAVGRRKGRRGEEGCVQWPQQTPGLGNPANSGGECGVYPGAGEKTGLDISLKCVIFFRTAEGAKSPKCIFEPFLFLFFTFWTLWLQKYNSSSIMGHL